MNTLFKLRLRIALTVCAALVLLLPAPPAAHEVPANVTVLAFVRPEVRTLRLLVRAPLESMRDIEWPLRGPGYLVVDQAEPKLSAAAKTWIADYIEFYENGRRLPDGVVTAVRASLPSDRSFATYNEALASIRGAPLATDVEIPWQQAMIDVLIEYPITSDQSKFSLKPGLDHLGVRTITVLRFLPPGTGERAFQYVGNPGIVRLDPRWHQAAFQFVKLGFFHILDGIDHLLFVLCLVIPFRRFRPLVAIVTSFTVAHSITLIASATGLAPSALWFPPLIEMLIALSILFMALENIVGARLQRRWLIAFAFGLVHGFGFSFVLRDSMQFAGAHVATSLVSFNIGVELGQLLVVAIAIPVLALLYRHVMAERVGTIILSALIAHMAWHWLTERWGQLREYDFAWPVLDAAFLAGVMRGLMLLLLLAGTVWLLYSVFGRMLAGGTAGKTEPRATE
ncbi:MAG: HupE/UreJ family protein [Gemmatimonadota bacterium]